MAFEVPQPSRRNEDTRETPDLEKEPLLPFPELEIDGEIEKYVHQHAEIEFEGARQTVIEILKVVKDDEQAIKMINSTLRSIFCYIETIYNMEINVRMLSLRWEGQELAEKIERHDARRKRSHDELISNLVATTRYLNTHFSGQVPQTGIYNGTEIDLTDQNRLAIADWAIELEHEILLARKK